MEERPERGAPRKRTTTLADMVRLSSASLPIPPRVSPAPPSNDLPSLIPPEPEAPLSALVPTASASRPGLPRRLIRDPFPEPLPLVVPPSQPRAVQLVPPPRTAGRPQPSVFRRVRPALFIALIASIAIVFGVNAHLASVPGAGAGGVNNANVANGNGQLIPPPSGTGPWDASVASVIVIPPPPPKPKVKTEAPVFAIQPCQSSIKFLRTISQWAVPPGCYAYIYRPNPANYVSRPGFGFCNWWVRVTHPNHPDITENASYPRGTRPMAGAPIFFDGGEQGAESIGHWAVAVAVSSDNYWVLISEMNFAWRGAGFGLIDYRYIHVSPHVHFVYILN